MPIPYPLARRALFTLDAERAHDLTLKMLKKMPKSGGWFAPQPAPCPVKVMGITFPNPVGLAAGLDKNAACLDGLAQMGFGFLEVGTITPRPQAGNSKPRMFRLAQHQAIINRLGFNNLGVDQLLKNINNSQYYHNKGILGINIGKNADTPLEKAHEDYVLCLDKVYEKASYITVNISSPNTQGLRSLQQGDNLHTLLKILKQKQMSLADKYGIYVPFALKIAPDNNDQQLALIADALHRHGIDGVIATNTTIERPAYIGEKWQNEAGGLSGAPLTTMSNEITKKLSKLLGDNVPIIGVGGIMSGTDAKQRMQSGASLVQLYSGFIYHGTQLITDSVNQIIKK